jgi:hypothetical protein
LQLRHPHIVPVEFFGEDDGYAYLIMPYLRPGSLKDRCCLSRVRGSIPIISWADQSENVRPDSTLLLWSTAAPAVQSATGRVPTDFASLQAPVNPAKNLIFDAIFIQIGPTGSG